MKLSSILLLGAKHWPNGSVWIGKHRLVRPIGANGKASQLKRLVWEYEVMKMLAKPYLTEVQEATQPDWTKTIEQRDCYVARRTNMDKLDHKTIDDHLRHLKTTSWE